AGVRCSLLRALGNVPNDKSFAILKRSAVDEDGDICDAGVRCSLLRALGNVPNDKSFAILKRSAVDEDGDICDAAIRALAVWPDQRAMGILSEMAFKSSDSKNRVIALRGYIRLVGVDVELSLEEKVEIYSRAIRGASGDNEKKLILAGLANVEHFTALETVAAYLDEPAVAEEACLAAVRIARATAGVMPARVRLAAQRVKGTAKSERTRSQADEIIRAINRFGDHIVAWQVCGPYAKDGLNYSRLFDEVFAPEIAGGDVKWSLLPIDVSNPKPWILDLLKLYPGQQRAAYVRTTIHSKSKQRAVLEIGKDDGIKVWLNGKVVHSSNTAGAVTPGADKVNIVLEQGSNSLMLKVTQNTSAWGFCARLVNPAGGKVEGVTVDCCGEQEMSTIDKSGAGKAVSIFDGRSFAGWEGNLDAFRIEDGAIVGGTLKEKIPRNEFLCSEKQYGDFELRLKVKLLGDNANAGIQIRSRRIPNHHEVIGYQADMGQQYWGCLYDESRRRKVLAWADKAEVAKVLKPGDWNDYTIRCEGKRIGLWINGYKTVDYVEADESVEQVGVIGLQIHSGGASEAWYKDITLKELQ
ncbi:MAG: DUF1080 domain-containing protein, partial [Anaerohalosphaera sp.]|nr:DUF1080 domain-containing protein [Anaerohalosphaera sp.]